MAQVESKFGVRSTFYIMARSPYYRAQDADARACIARIVACGHAVGLHIDLGTPRTSYVAPEATLSVIATDRARVPVTSPSVSFHCPPDSLLWVDVPGCDSAYAPEWEGRYLSDSRGVFAYGDPEDHPDRPLALNLHPEHWFGGMPEDLSGWFWR